MESSALSDGAQQANIVSNENAEAMFGADQAETNMIKLVDGKLVPIGDTHDDVMDEQLRNRYSSDEERSLQGDQQRSKTYENSDAALRAGNGITAEDMPDDETATTLTLSFTIPTGMMPTTPGIPDPTTPYPGTPMPTQPGVPSPVPEIPTLPGTPQPAIPEIQEPDQPNRSHEINSHSSSLPGLITFTSSYDGMNLPTDATTQARDTVEPGEAVPGNQYEGMSAGIDDTDGMTEKPDTGKSARPYDIDAQDTHSFQSGEMPQETAQMMSQPREQLDESASKKADMAENESADPSEVKSTEGLDRHYNDPGTAPVI